MDLEGSDGRERGEDDTSFERQSALFALSAADVLLVNMWAKVGFRKCCKAMICCTSAVGTSNVLQAVIYCTMWSHVDVRCFSAGHWPRNGRRQAAAQNHFPGERSAVKCPVTELYQCFAVAFAG